MLKSIALVASLFLMNVLSAQTRVDSLNGYGLSKKGDEKILNHLASLEKGCGPVKTNTGTKTTNTSTKATSTSTEPKKELTTAEICRNSPKLLGFKIQVGVGKNSTEANDMRADFRSKFPALKTEVDASLRPHYKLLAGSYFSKESAKDDYKQIKRYYSTAMLIPYRIFCAEAK
jgi:cell division septation protein DedD